MKNLIVRSSSVNRIMTEPKEKSPKHKYKEACILLSVENEKLSNIKDDKSKSYINKTAKIKTVEELIKKLEPEKDTIIISESTKTWLKDKVKAEFFEYKTELNSPPILKGIDYEFLSIELLNELLFQNYEKNEERKTNDWLTGECDIATDDEIIDVKSSWSLETFPVFQEDAEDAVKKAGYDWQLRAYMMLWDKPKASVRYCMISTPEHLLKDWDNRDVHRVDHIAANFRVTTVTIERDKDIEAKMLERYEVANKYYQMYLNELKNK